MSLFWLVKIFWWRSLEMIKENKIWGPTNKYKTMQSEAKTGKFIFLSNILINQKRLESRSPSPFTHREGLKKIKRNFPLKGGRVTKGHFPLFNFFIFYAPNSLKFACPKASWSFFWNIQWWNTFFFKKCSENGPVLEKNYFTFFHF